MSNGLKGNWPRAFLTIAKESPLAPSFIVDVVDGLSVFMGMSVEREAVLRLRLTTVSNGKL